jgi:hypothetical protein
MDGYQIDNISCNPTQHFSFIPFDLIQTVIQSKPFSKQYENIIPKNQYLFTTKIGTPTKLSEIYFEQIEYECVAFKIIPITTASEKTVDRECKILTFLSDRCNYVPHIYFLGYCLSTNFKEKEYKKSNIIAMEYCVTDWNFFCESIHKIDLEERCSLLYKCCIRLIEIIYDLNCKQKVCHNYLLLEHICFRLKDDGGLEPILIDFSECTIYEEDGYNDLIFFCKQMSRFYSEKNTFDKVCFTIFQKWMKKMEKQLDWDLDKCKFWCTEAFQINKKPTSTKPKKQPKKEFDNKILDFSNIN